MSDGESDGVAGPFARSATFWTVVALVTPLGLTMGFVALVYVGAIDWLTELIWGDDPEDTALWSGEAWWIALMGGMGLLVGLMRKFLRIDESPPGLFDELAARRVDPRPIPREVAVSFVCLVSGASVGPEASIGAMGGGLGTWIAERRKLPPAARQATMFSGMAGGFGGLFTSPYLATSVVIEGGAPAKATMSTTIVATLLASTLGFGVVYAVSGEVFFNVYDVMPYDLRWWDLLLAVGLGVFGAFLAVVVGVGQKATRQALGRFNRYPVQLAVAGGLALGVIAFAIPVTRFSGSGNLETVLLNASEFGAGLLFLVVAAKIVAFLITFGTGFIGGPIFPLIFIGGTAGVAVNQAIPDIPQGLAVVCLLAAVPGAIARIPFTLGGIAALSVTVGGPEQAAPAFLAVATSYVLVTGLHQPPGQDSAHGGREPHADLDDSLEKEELA
jgi:H+/Cl- antiporter ClcA